MCCNVSMFYKSACCPVWGLGAVGGSIGPDAPLKVSCVEALNAHVCAGANKAIEPFNFNLVSLIIHPAYTTICKYVM